MSLWLFRFDFSHAFTKKNTIDHFLFFIADLQELEGRTPLLEPGTTYQLPMLPVDDALVCPGDYFPLRINDPRLRQVVSKAMQAPLPLSRLIALIVMTNQREAPFDDGGARLSFNTIACTIEIIKQSADGQTLLTQGRQKCELDFKNSPQPLDFQRISMHVIADTLPRPLPFSANSNQVAFPQFVYQSVDAVTLAKTARNSFKQKINIGGAPTREGDGDGEGEGSISATTEDICEASDPIELSYWMIGNLPFNQSQRKSLFQEESVIDRLSKEIDMIKEMESVYCRDCNFCIGSIDALIQVNNEGIGGHYVNSHGALHDMLTLKNARARIVSNPEIDNSWFPGYAWQIAYCQGCREHLGWYFTAVEGSRGTPSRDNKETIDDDGDYLPERFFGLRTAALDNKARSNSLAATMVAMEELLQRQGIEIVNEEEEGEEDGEGEEEEGGSEWETDSGSGSYLIE